MNLMLMKLQKSFFFFTLTLIYLLFSQIQAQNISDSTNSTAVMVYPTWLSSSQTQYNQFLADSFNYFVTPKGNRVWACAMSLAWNELKRNMLEGYNATFFNLGSLPQKMVDNLNSEWFTRNDLSEETYYVASGFGPEMVEKINYEVRQKFPGRTFLPLNSTLQQKDFISFAYLFKQFKFEFPFASIPVSWKGSTVDGFQAIKSKMKQQIYYKYYNSRDDFMIGLETDSPDDEILLWKTNQTGINDAKFEKVLKMIELYDSLPSTRISRQDLFRMPVVNVEYERNYQDMIGARFSNPGYEDYQISKMSEKIKLKVTRLGVTLENQAVIISVRTSSFSTKYFYLDNDFWLIMKEKNKKPYLIMLVKQVSETANI